MPICMCSGTATPRARSTTVDTGDPMINASGKPAANPYVVKCIASLTAEGCLNLSRSDCVSKWWENWTGLDTLIGSVVRSMTNENYHINSQSEYAVFLGPAMCCPLPLDM